MLSLQLRLFRGAEWLRACFDRTGRREEALTSSASRVGKPGYLSLVTAAATVLVLFLAVPVQAQQHAHIYAGALGTNQNDKLYFSNGTLFITNSGYVQPLSFASNGVNAGYYQGTLTFSALAATVPNAGPAFGHAALGARLQLQVVSIAGPAGGQFGFWEGNDGENGDQLTFSVPVGTTNGTATFPLSENHGSPGTDPYGHIHGRVFTVTLPGLYSVGFRILDSSTNGIGGGPIQAPSDIFPIYFQAGLSLVSITRTTNGVAVIFGTQSGKSYFLESRPASAPAVWQTLAGPAAGNSRLQSLSDTNTANSARFYRVRSP
jgi:hypothetical protein